MTVFSYHPGYFASVGDHVHQVEKYQKTYDRLRAAGIPEDAFSQPDPASDEEVGLVHTAEYIADLRNGVHTFRTLPSELPIGPEIVSASFLATGGTIQAARVALNNGKALNLTGGFHHAFPAQAEGFCYINDLAVAISVMKNDGLIHRAAVIDCDLHQGNGTAFIFQKDKTVFTFSIHQEDIYPQKKKSDIDVGLYDLATDDDYLPCIRENVPKILDGHKPDLVIYQAGADPFAGDQLGTLKFTKAGIRERDEIVLFECRKRSIPIAGTLGGGYAVNPEDTVDIHYGTAISFWEG